MRLEDEWSVAQYKCLSLTGGDAVVGHALDHERRRGCDHLGAEKDVMAGFNLTRFDASQQTEGRQPYRQARGATAYPAAFGLAFGLAFGPSGARRSACSGRRRAGRATGCSRAPSPEAGGQRPSTWPPQKFPEGGSGGEGLGKRGGGGCRTAAATTPVRAGPPFKPTPSHGLPRQ